MTEFIRMVLKNEPIDETLIGEDGLPVSAEPEQPAEEKKTSFFGKLFKS